MKNTLNIEVLIAHLERYIEARNEERECFEACETSPGYFCRRYTDEKEQKASDFGEALANFIDGRIKEFLDKNTILTKKS